MLGTWLLDILADGSQLYSDSFSISPIVQEKLETANSSLINENQELDKLLQEKRRQLSELETQIESIRADSLEWLGRVAQRCEEYGKSDEHYKKALEIRQKLGDEEGLLLGLAKERKQYAEAEEYGLKALQIHTRLGDKGSQKEISEGLRAIRDLRHATE